MMMLGLYSAPPSQGGQLLLDCTPFAQRVSCSTDAHGFEGLQAALSRPLRDAFRIYDAPVLYVGLFWGGQIVWEGRLEDPALSVGNQGSGLSLTALGAWRTLSDLPYTALWSTTLVDTWRPILITENAAFTPDRYKFSTQGELYIAPEKNSVLGNTGVQKVGGLCFLAPDGASRNIIGAQFAVEFVAPAANWRAAFQNRNADFSVIASPFLFTSAGAGTTLRALHLTFSSAPIVNIFMDFNAADAAYAGESGANYLRVTHMRLVSTTEGRVNTTLTANRNAGTNVTATVGSTTGMYVGMELVMNSGNNPSEIVTVLSIGSSTQFNATFANNYVIGNTVQGFKVTADSIVRDIVINQINATNPSQLSSATILIQSPGLDLTDQVYEDAAIGDILTNLASLGDTSGAAWETGVYEGRTVFFRAQGSASRAWYVDASDLSVARSLEQLANSIYPVYQDANGVAQRSTPTSDATSIARYGLTRRTALPADTTIAATAALFTATALADRKDPQPRATIRFDAIYDAVGARYPLWLVRSGDTITIRNLPPNVSTSVDRIRTFRISHTSYDDVADTLAVEPELPPPTLEVMLARRAEGIAV